VAQCSPAPKRRPCGFMMTRAPTQGRMLKEGLTLAGKEGVLDCTALSFFQIVTRQVWSFSERFPHPNG